MGEIAVWILLLRVIANHENYVSTVTQKNIIDSIIKVYQCFEIVVFFKILKCSSYAKQLFFQLSSSKNFGILTHPM